MYYDQHCLNQDLIRIIRALHDGTVVLRSSHPLWPRTSMQSHGDSPDSSAPWQVFSENLACTVKDGEVRTQCL